MINEASHSHPALPAYPLPIIIGVPQRPVSGEREHFFLPVPGSPEERSAMRPVLYQGKVCRTFQGLMWGINWASYHATYFYGLDHLAKPSHLRSVDKTSIEVVTLDPERDVFGTMPYGRARDLLKGPCDILRIRLLIDPLVGVPRKVA